MKNQPAIEIDTVVEWQYDHWEADEWSVVWGVLKYQKDSVIVVEIEGRPLVLDGRILTIRAVTETP